MHGIQWGSLDIAIVLHVSITAMYFVFGVKLKSSDSMYTTLPDLLHRFYTMKQSHPTLF